MDFSCTFSLFIIIGSFFCYYYCLRLSFCSSCVVIVFLKNCHNLYDFFHQTGRRLYQSEIISPDQPKHQIWHIFLALQFVVNPDRHERAFLKSWYWKKKLKKTYKFCRYGRIFSVQGVHTSLRKKAWTETKSSNPERAEVLCISRDCKTYLSGHNHQVFNPQRAYRLLGCLILFFYLDVT